MMHWPLNDTPSPLDKGERQMYEWMCRFVRDMASKRLSEYAVDQDYNIAREIASLLPADPEKQAVRDILSRHDYVIPVHDDSEMWHEDGCAAKVALECLKLGREMQKEGK